MAGSIRSPGDRGLDIAAARSNCRFASCTQHESLNLSGRRLGKIIDKLDPPWIFVGRKARFDECLELGAQRGGGREPLCEDHKRDRLDQLIVIFLSDYRRLLDCSMASQRRFDLDW